MKHLSLLALLALPITALAHDYTVGDLVIAHPIAYETTSTAQSGAGYMMITNNGDEADTLLKAEADFPRVMLHESVLQDDVATMVHLDAVEIPAGATVAFMPGGKHVMFMGLNGDPFEVGEEITSTLTFEKAGVVEVVFKVEAREASEEKEEDHSGH